MAVWPQLSEAHAVAFSLARPDLSCERKVLLGEDRALREVVLDTGAPHLLTNRNWRQAFVAVCSTCMKEAPLAPFRQLFPFLNSPARVETRLSQCRRASTRLGARRCQIVTDRLTPLRPMYICTCQQHRL